MDVIDQGAARPLSTYPVNPVNLLVAVFVAVTLAFPAGSYLQSLVHKARVEHCVGASSTGMADIAYCDATN